MIHLKTAKRLKWKKLSRFDSVLLGDNPFFGIDHLSHERSRSRLSNAKNFENAIQVIQCARDYGVKDMMVGTRPRLNEFFEELNDKTNILNEFNFHPVVPYAQGFVLKLNEKGLINTLQEIFKKGGLKNEIKLLVRGGLGFLKKDFEELFKMFIDVELLKLKGVNIKTIYLHPLFTDLILALNLKDIFSTYLSHLRKQYNVNAGLCTKNFPTLVSKLNEWELDYPYIMTSFNKAGLFMNPSRKECEDVLQFFRGKTMAMNIFAGGYYNLDETFQYIDPLSKIRDVVVGVSTVDHAKKTFQLLLK